MKKLICKFWHWFKKLFARQAKITKGTGPSSNEKNPWNDKHNK